MKKALKTVELLVLQCFFFCKRGTQIFHKIISTHHLTWLITYGITYLTQRKALYNK